MKGGKEGVETGETERAAIERSERTNEQEGDAAAEGCIGRREKALFVLFLCLFKIRGREMNVI